MGDVPGSAILDLFDQLINRVKQTHPVRTDGKPLGGGMVYSQLVLGMPVDPNDYHAPWSPMGGSTLQEIVAQPAASGGTPAGTAPPKLAADPRFSKSMEAAFKTAQLANIMLQVTTDGSYLEYPTGRHLDFQYDQIVHGMQPLPMPPIPPEVQKQIDDSRHVLYDLDPNDGSISGKSQLYRLYLKNARTYAQAKAAYAEAMAAARADPNTADIWPQESVTYQNDVDSAWDTWKTEGAEQVERALDVIESVGISLQDREIAKARKLFDAWNLGLAGVPIAVPYSYISPTGWCDPTDDSDGWQRLKVKKTSSNATDTSRFSRGSQGSWSTDSSATGGSAAVSIGFAAFGGSADSSSSHSQWQGSSGYQFSNAFHNDASDLTIDIEYALCSIMRPWLVSDLFYMKNWYLVGQDKNSISTGIIADQVETDKPLMAMIPEQMLVIRNVNISSTNWGSDSAALASYYGGDQGSSDSSSSSEAGSGGVCLGFVNFGGSASHSQSHGEGQSSGWGAASGDSYFGATFQNNTLSIQGAQIVAFLNDIVPASPPLPDPNLDKMKASGATSGTAAAGKT